MSVWSLKIYLDSHTGSWPNKFDIYTWNFFFYENQRYSVFLPEPLKRTPGFRRRVQSSKKLFIHDFFSFFFYGTTVLTCLDPDRDFQAGSGFGSTDLFESGSETKAFCLSRLPIWDVDMGLWLMTNQLQCLRIAFFCQKYPSMILKAIYNWFFCYSLGVACEIASMSVQSKGTQASYPTLQQVKHLLPKS